MCSSFLARAPHARPGEPSAGPTSSQSHPRPRPAKPILAPRPVPCNFSELPPKPPLRGCRWCALARRRCAPTRLHAFQDCRAGRTSESMLGMAPRKRKPYRRTAATKGTERHCVTLCRAPAFGVFPQLEVFWEFLAKCRYRAGQWLRGRYDYE